VKKGFTAEDAENAEKRQKTEDREQNAEKKNKIYGKEGEVLEQSS